MRSETFGLFRAVPQRPRFLRCVVAEPRWFRFAWNRYTGLSGSATIGAAVVIGRHCYSLTWARPHYINSTRPRVLKGGADDA
jgi:hypothetical protein